VEQWVARLNHNSSVVGAYPTKGSGCFIEQDIYPHCSIPVDSRNVFDRDFTISQTLIRWGSYRRWRKCQIREISPKLKYSPASKIISNLGVLVFFPEQHCLRTQQKGNVKSRLFSYFVLYRYRSK